MTRREDPGIDQEYLRGHQYRDPTNLNARIALHTKYSRADEPWYTWLGGRIEWPEGGEVLEVGCGSGALWVNIASLLPDLRLTLTDLSDGMVEAATRAVAVLDALRSWRPARATCRSCRSQMGRSTSSCQTRPGPPQSSPGCCAPTAR